MIGGSYRGGGKARPDARLGSLTEREREVFALVAQGMSNAEISAALHVSGNTTKTHVARVLAKLGLRDRVHAVIFAYQAGLQPGRAPRVQHVSGEPSRGRARAPQTPPGIFSRDAAMIAETPGPQRGPDSPREPWYPRSGRRRLRIYAAQGRYPCRHTRCLHGAAPFLRFLDWVRRPVPDGAVARPIRNVPN